MNNNNQSSKIGIGDIRNGRGDVLPMTETGNADRLAEIVKDNARFVPEAKSWMVWHDGAWQKDDGRALMTEYATKIANDLNNTAATFAEANNLSDAKKALDASRAAQTKKMIDAIIDLLARKPIYRMAQSAFDANPLLVGFYSARRVIDLKTGVTRDAQRDDYVTKSLGIDAVCEAKKAVQWLKFLDDVFNKDTDLIAWLKRWCGYLLTGKTSEHCLLFLYGHGANGKSVFIETLSSLLGEYSRVVGGETLLNSTRNAQSASPDLARLFGARLATSVETEDGKGLAESLIKTLTGGDAITARHLHCEPFEFTPEFKLMIAGNHKPNISGTDHGIWRRIHLVPFTQTFSGDNIDTGMLGKLRKELHHIAAWCVEGAVEWQRDGLGATPKCVEGATNEYRGEMDTVGEFISDCCDIDALAFTATNNLFARYQQWCRSAGLPIPINNTFGRRLGERQGLRSGKQKGVRGVFGIRPRAIAVGVG
jgi:P4 family phage/plasmid primase-like protien